MRNNIVCAVGVYLYNEPSIYAILLLYAQCESTHNIYREFYTTNIDIH